MRPILKYATETRAYTKQTKQNISNVEMKILIWSRPYFPTQLPYSPFPILSFQSHNYCDISRVNNFQGLFDGN